MIAPTRSDTDEVEGRCAEVGDDDECRLGPFDSICSFVSTAVVAVVVPSLQTTTVCNLQLINQNELCSKLLLPLTSVCQYLLVLLLLVPVLFCSGVFSACEAIANRSWLVVVVSMPVPAAAAEH